MGDGWYVRQFTSLALNHNDALRFTAMERATYASKSFLVALALVTRHIDVDQAAHVEVNSQIELWGEVEDSKYIVGLVLLIFLTELLL